MDIESFDYADSGLRRVYENEKWTVGIKNWKSANDIATIDCLERHNQSDELGRPQGSAAAMRNGEAVR